VLQEEARLFFQEITIKEDGGISDILTRPVTFVNNRTAAFYGLSGSFGTSLQRVDLDPAKRAGLLTHVGFLSKYGSQTQSDPILRGVHIALEVLCAALPAPPPNVPPLPEIEEGQSNRERVETATSVAPCNTCHTTRINPIGFAFEHYNAVGAWRDTDNGKPVNAAAQYTVDGKTVSYDGAIEFSQMLADSPTVHACYSRNWLEYVLGRPARAEEVGVVDKISLISNSGTLSDLLAAITALDTFRARPEESL
jgi:hypothetical protein